jgi:hypothetical protein
MDDAGAALAGVAADMGAGEPQILAQELHQKVRASTSDAPPSTRRGAVSWQAPASPTL